MCVGLYVRYHHVGCFGMNIQVIAVHQWQCNADALRSDDNQTDMYGIDLDICLVSLCSLL